MRGKHQDEILALIDDLIELRVESARFHAFHIIKDPVSPTRQLVVEDLYEKFPAFSSVTDENLIPHNPSAAFARFPDAIFHAV